MKLFAITDNHDTLMGLRLAGIEGVIVQDAAQASQALKNAVENSDIGIVLMTDAAAKLLNETLNTVRRQKQSPLIVEIPDRHVTRESINESLSQYVKQALGAKL